MESLKIDNIGTGEGIREILGFLHHRISQQEKDIALLNRRVAELIQNSKSSEQSTVQAFIEASNCRLDSFSASIQSLTDQMVKFTVPSQIQLINKSKNNLNELKNGMKEEINQINTEIESLKAQMIRLNTDKDKCLNSSFQSDLNSNKDQNEQINQKPKIHKKSKSKKSKIVSISIFDIKPNQNNHNPSKLQYKTDIESLTNEINQLKKTITKHNEISNQKFLSINKRIDDLEGKLNSTHTESLPKSDENLISEQNSKKLEIDFPLNKEIENEIDSLTEKVYPINIRQQNSQNLQVIQSSDSLDILPFSDNELNSKISQKNSLTNINYNTNNNSLISKHKSFASTAKLNSQAKKVSQSKMTQNATPRKTATHYTLINGDCLKRPGSQMIQKRVPYKTAQQKYPM